MSIVSRYRIIRFLVLNGCCCSRQEVIGLLQRLGFESVVCEKNIHHYRDCLVYEKEALCFHVLSLKSLSQDESPLCYSLDFPQSSSGKVKDFLNLVD